MQKGEKEGQKCMGILGNGTTLGLIILLAEIFLLANPTVISVTEPSKVQNIMMIYLIMQATVLAGLGLASPSFHIMETGHFLVGAMLTFAIVFAIPGSIVAGFEPLPVAARTATFTIGLIYIFLKVYIEEILFRKILAPRLGGIIQAAMFGLFHFTVLSVGGASVGAVAFGAFFLALLGYVWWVMSETIGFQVAVGSHFMWNAHAYGVF